MSNGTIICCAVTGAGDTRGKNPAVPVTPHEIARSSIDAAKAGASIVHVHVRDPDTGRPSMALDHYREVMERIREEDPNVIINLTSGPGARLVPDTNDPRQSAEGTTLAPIERRLEHIIELRPEICSLDVTSMNFGDYVVVNSAPSLRRMAAAIREAGVMPELEVFEPGQIRLARQLIDQGLLEGPGLFQLCLGIAWGTPATTEAMTFMRGLLPDDSTWFAFGIANHQFPMVAQALLLGGHVRVGLEDNLYLERGRLAPSNAALVEKAATIVEALGQSVASPAEARSMLGLRAS